MPVDSLGSYMVCANSKGSDQTVQMHSLIKAFAVGMCHKHHFCMLGLKVILVALQ